MKIFKIESSIVFRCEESLNLFSGKKKLDKVVSGRIIKEIVKILGIKVRTRYRAVYCFPIIDKENALVKSALDKVVRSVKDKCICKMCDYYNNDI